MAEPTPSPQPYDVGPVASLAAAVLDRPPTLSRTRLLAIDGPAGSGKTTLARHVTGLLAADQRAVELISLDDLYDGWSGLNPTLETRVLSQVLVPLAAGEQAHWQSYDWSLGRFHDWHLLSGPDVLVLEGCGAGARRYAAYTTLLVWLEAAQDVRTARAVARDGDEVLAHWANWIADERRHYAANQTSARADIRIST